MNSEGRQRPARMVNGEERLEGGECRSRSTRGEPVSLLIPKYVKKAEVVGAPIGYKWDDATSDEIYTKPDQVLQNQIDKVSDRAIVALSVGFAEWVTWRFQPNNFQQDVLQFIEATWAGIIDWRYLAKEPPKHVWDEWEGSVLGPLSAAFNLLWEVLQLTMNDEFASPESVSLSRLALYVLPRPDSFRMWRRSTLLRLIKTHPRCEDEQLGSPVPREALDPSLNYDPEGSRAYLRAFLESLDCAANPYLASPKAMKAAGFEGTPYTY